VRPASQTLSTGGSATTNVYGPRPAAGSGGHRKSSCALVETEITAREASNARTRLKAAAFPFTKTLEEFDRTVSSVPGATLDYLASGSFVVSRRPPLRPQVRCALQDQRGLPVPLR